MPPEILNASDFDVHTADAYYGNVKYYGTNCLIPYINLALFDDKKRRFNKIVNHFNYGYLILKDFEEHKVSLEEVTNDNENRIILYLGGTCIFPPSFKGDELNVIVKNALFQLTPISRISENKINGIDFIPIDTPDFRPTLDEATTKRFLNYEFLNPEFKRLFEIS